MNQFIENILCNIFDQFIINLQYFDNYCHLRELRFDNNIPPYEELTIQQLYLIRYLPAYLIEYYDIFRKVLRNNFIDYPLNILSIGTGCGLDYFGLEYALRMNNTSCSNCVIYTGIDRIDWHYRDYLNNRHCEFTNIDINDWENLRHNDYNIIIFPKSISEFDNDTFQHLSTLFRNANFLEDRIVLICSFRSDQIMMQNNRFVQLSEIFQNIHNYTINPHEDIFRYAQEGYLNTISQGFQYPRHILNYIRELPQKCRNYNVENMDCHSCGDIIGRHPIIKNNYILYSIYFLTQQR